MLINDQHDQHDQRLIMLYGNISQINMDMYYTIISVSIYIYCIIYIIPSLSINFKFLKHYIITTIRCTQNYSNLVPKLHSNILY